MTQYKPSIDRSILKVLYPLSLLSDHLLDSLVSKVDIIFPEMGSTIVKGRGEDKYYHYLLEGRVEYRKSFDDRVIIDCRDSRCTHSLEELVINGGVIKAQKQCGVMVVARDVVNQFISWSESQTFRVVHIDADRENNDDEKLLDDDFQSDWTEIFLQSALAANIPAQLMMQLFSELDDVTVAAGEIIVKEGSEGDYFYIVKSGYANVITNDLGPFSGKVIVMAVGDYFGDEALVADTMRNASVVMETNGVLGRLSRKSFNELIKKPLIRLISEDDFNAIGHANLMFLDVRLAAEYRHGHYEKAKNYPIAYIRKHLETFERDSGYVITAECQRRSELAVYLMRQAGYDVYLLNNSSS